MALTRSKAKRIACPFCDVQIGKEDAFKRHLSSVHNEHRDLRQIYVSHVLNDIEPRCRCGCDLITRFVNYRKGFSEWINGHNAEFSALPADEANMIREKRNGSLRETYRSGRAVSWSKGLTKKTDERLAASGPKKSKALRAAFASGKRVQWSKGLTKETDARLAKSAAGISDAYRSGRSTQWMKGKTAKTDERVAALGAKVSMTLARREVKERMNKAKRRSNDELRRLIEARGFLQIVGGLDEYKRETSELSVTCRACFTILTKPAIQLFSGRCHVCEPKGSLEQLDLTTWLSSIVGPDNAVTCDRNVIKPLELDIYVPSSRLAIEYNGLYWHSILNKSATYHSNKSNKCSIVDVHLIHVFEDEWRERKDVVKSMILHRLGMTPRRIYARKCYVKEMTSLERRTFFEANHIDGDVATKNAHCLVFEGEIVAAVSLRRPFHRVYAGHLELARFCCALNTTVVGGLSRLIKHVKRLHSQPIITYVDMRYGDGHGYERVGFHHVSTTQCRFWWTDFEHRFNRFKFRADKKRGMTEEDVAREAGVYRIWGCPNRVYVLD